MNNTMFVLMRYLRDNGIDAELLLFPNEFDHFQPKGDTYTWDKFKDHVKMLEWGTFRDFFTGSKQKIIDSVKHYDLTIGCGWTPAFFQKAGLKLDIILSYGGDIHYMPTKRFVNLNPRLDKKLLNYFLSKAQEKGIRNAGNRLLQTVKDYYLVKEQFGDIFLGMHAMPLYLPDYDDLAGANNIEMVHKDTFDKLRAENDILLFNHSRQLWKTFKGTGTVFGKGNHKMIEGYAQYLKQANKSSKLVMFEYGVDVLNSKKLVAELGIGDNVVWMPKMPRNELLYGLKFADLASDAFNSGDFGSTACEVWLVDKPLMNYIKPSQEEYDKYMMKMPLPPVINVNTSDEIAKSLVDYELRPDHYVALGIKGGKWFREYMGDGLVKKWVSFLNDIHSDKEINIDNYVFGGHSLV